MTGILAALFVALLAALIVLSLHRMAPQATVAGLRIGFGVVAALGGLWAAAARQPAVALGLAGAAALLLRPLVGGWRARPMPGRVSEARTRVLVATLDHDSGEMDGEILSGPFAGRRLSELAPEELQRLFDACEGDEETLALLTIYLERRGIDTGAAPPPPDPAAMSEEEAYRLLGLAPGASLEEVRAAYRRLMRKVHPDLGGSPALAALLNAAKNRLDPGA
jgi:hypothetical protein